MKTIIRHYKTHPIRVSIHTTIPFAMFNGVDVAKALEINFFEWLESEQIKEDIAAYKKIASSNDHKEKSILNIESSTEIYLHPLLFMRLTWGKDNEFYLWHFNVSDEALKASVKNQTLV